MENFQANIDIHQDRFGFSGEVPIQEFMLAVWQGKWIIFGFVLLFSCVALIQVYQLPNVYRAEVLLAPASEESSSTAMSGGIGGLVGLAGIRIGGSSIDRTTLGIETLQSRAFLMDFIERHELLVPIMAAKAWDVREAKWEFDQEIYDENKKMWISNDEHKKPSRWKAYNRFISFIEINEDKKNRMITITVDSLSPQYAKHWADQLVLDLNDYLRKKDVDEAQKSVDYLEKELSGTSIAEMKNVLYGLIEEQIKIIMLAKVRSEYAFRVIDPALVPEEKVGPKRATTVLLAGFLGGMVAVTGLVVIKAVRSRRRYLKNLMQLQQ